MRAPVLPHHPSSAELAAFRRAIPTRDAHYERVPGAPFRETASGRAWPWERRHGIGHTVGPRGNVIFRATDPSTEARAGANALRRASHAAHWAFLPNTWMTPGHPKDVQTNGAFADQVPGSRYFVAAWPDELARGLPTWPYPLAGQACDADLECGSACAWDDDNGFVREGTRGGNGDPEEDVQFVCICEHHQP